MTDKIKNSSTYGEFLDHIVVGSDSDKYTIEGVSECCHYCEHTDRKDVALEIVKTMLTYKGIRSVCLREWGEVKQIFFPNK